MNIFHASVPFEGTFYLKPFGTAMVFEPEELYIVERIVDGMLQSNITDESRQVLTDIYERVRVTHTQREVQ